MSAVRVATAPISWGVCEIPDWGEVLPSARVLDEMRECGYEGTELGPWGYLPRDAATLRRELGRRGLALVGAFCPVTLHDPARYGDQMRYARETIALLADLGAPVLVLAEGGGDPERFRLAGRASGARRFSKEEWERFAEGTNGVARHARERGLVTAFHPHAGTFVETPDEVDELLARTDADLVGLCLDTGHIAYGGGDPLALARREAGRIRHVHLKDMDRARYERGLAGGLSFPDAVGERVFTAVGEGSLPMGAIIRALRDAGYSGWLVVEEDIRIPAGTTGDPRRDARASLAFIRAQLG